MNAINIATLQELVQSHTFCDAIHGGQNPRSRCSPTEEGRHGDPAANPPALPTVRRRNGGCAPGRPLRGQRTSLLGQGLELSTHRGQSLECEVHSW